jgi:small conductance mechanosensitive channel
LASINKLREEQTALLDRVNAATDALRAKGGDVQEYEQYTAAVSGIQVDVKDISATRAMIVGWLRSPEGGIRWAKTIISFVVIVVVSLILASILGRLTRRAVAVNKKCSDLLKDFLVNIVRKIVLIIGLVVALSMLGVNVGPLVGGIAALGFIIGFALQGTLGNFAAGLMILLHRPYDVGDVVNTAGIVGTVQSMNLNTTTIKTFDNQVVVVPNGSIWGDNITNVTGSDTRRVDLVFGIGYSDDIGKAQGILEDIVKSHPLVLEEPAPNVKVHELGDSSVNFICRPWTQTSNYWTVYWDITRQVKERFDAEGVTIPFPQRDVHVYQEAIESSAATGRADVSPAIKS